MYMLIQSKQMYTACDATLLKAKTQDSIVLHCSVCTIIKHCAFESRCVVLKKIMNCTAQ